MLRTLGWYRVLVLLGLLVAGLIGACDCGTSPQCADAADCNGRTWDHPQCAENEGHWECQLMLCVETCGCVGDAECSGWTWPPDAGCGESAGAWQCVAAVCQATCPDECATPADCAGQAWPAAASCPETVGSWSCPDATCQASCPVFWCGDGHCDTGDGEDPTTCPADCVDDCGDGDCDELAGETDLNCPEDCAVTCVDAIDCVGGVWDVVCDGRWDCQAQTCVRVCDYVTCGDDACEAVNGEDAGSCNVDCFDGSCQWPNECRNENWGQICQGRWTCFMANCQATCDSNGCGNGTCDGALGETGTTCYADCGGGPCDVASDCVRYAWYESCVGHWQCDAGGGCEAVCDPTGCGDGTCDVLAGESTDSCVSDCMQWDCNLSSDCDPLTRPPGCTGSWACIGRVCVPICE